MLRGAVKEHEQKNGQPRLSQSSFPSTSSQPGLNKTAYQSANSNPNPGYRNPLKPSSASTINSQNYQSNRGGLKRTASGLAKALDGSFEDDGPGSRYQPVDIAAQEDFFGEDDFDSDIDLDIVEPLPMKNAVSYPKLPAQPTKAAPPPQAVTYPSLPKQQPAQKSTNSITGFVSMQPPARSEAPDSSAPVPWSSSPLEHFSAARPQQSLQQYTFDPRTGNTSTSTSTANATREYGAQPRPAKRRTLPWQVEEDDAVPTYSTASSKPRTQNVQSTFTPQSKDKSKDKSMYPWNTTASAIKEQQKKHREEKKAVKKHAGTDESIAAAKSNNKRPARVFLSEEQQHVLDLVIEQKKSVFFTGSAGTGKSVLMREIISQLRRKYSREPDRVAVTASTGLAACNVGGVTLHSFAGIGLGKEAIPELVRKIKKNQKARHRWMRTKVLVVDEVSMVDGDLFDKLESIARQIRNNMRPFGGIQLVITGDFFQLPPVPEGGRVSKFAFDAATWATSIEHTIGLHHVFRQKDPIFAGMLNEMREGRLSESSTAAFRKLSRPLTFEDMLDATELFPTRQEVEKANAERLRGLQGDLFPFPAKDGGSITDKTGRDRLLSNSLAPELITLKKGAQVMLIKNIDETLVNGSLGRVIGFMDERQFDSYNSNNEDTDLFPRTPGGTLIQNAGESAPSMDPRPHMMMNHITTARKWPLVRFAIADGTWRDLLCQPESWKVELPNGEVQASRSQIPLILAWALSIHKAQGQTLERVKVDLGKVFEKGQAYVALSRATSMAGLQVLRFDPKKVNAHERVRTFYSNLGRVELAEKNKDRMAKINKPSTTAANDYEQHFIDGEFD